MTMKLLDLYHALLSDVGGVPDNDGFVSLQRFDDKEPLLVKGKRLVLPTKEQLSHVDPSKVVVFHPLYEHSLRPESEVVAEYRRLAAEKLSLAYCALGAHLLIVAASQAEHKKLNAKQSKFLSLIPKADNRSIKDWGRLIAAMELGQVARTFVSIYLTKNGELEGRKHKRVAVVTFPLYTALVKDGQERERKMEERAQARKRSKEENPELPPAVPNETFGVDLRDKDREIFIRLIEYMVPGLNEADAIGDKLDRSMYSRASDSLIAPSMHALMQAFAELADPLNEVVELFKSTLPEAMYHSIKIKGEWVDAMNNLASFQADIKKIPMQAGNDGNPIPVHQPQEEVAAAESSHHSQSTHHEEPSVTEELQLPPGFKMPSRAQATPQSIVGSALPPAQQAQQRAPAPVARVAQAMPVHTPAVAYAPSHPAPAHAPRQVMFDPYTGAPIHQPVTHQPIQTRIPGQGVDFQAALQANPAFARAVYGNMPQPAGVPLADPNQHVPSWDRGAVNTQYAAGPGTYATNRPIRRGF